MKKRLDMLSGKIVKKVLAAWDLFQEDRKKIEKREER